jgi:hypothetical protein
MTVIRAANGLTIPLRLQSVVIAVAVNCPAACQRSRKTVISPTRVDLNRPVTFGT